MQPGSRRMFLRVAGSFLLLPASSRAQRAGALRVSISHLQQRVEGGVLRVSVEVALHNRARRRVSVVTGCRSVFDPLNGRVQRRAEVLAHGIDERVQLCSPAVPRPIVLPPGTTSERRTYLFDPAPARVRGRSFRVAGEIDGTTLVSNAIALP